LRIPPASELSFAPLLFNLPFEGERPGFFKGLPMRLALRLEMSLFEATAS